MKKILYGIIVIILLSGLVVAITPEEFEFKNELAGEILDDILNEKTEEVVDLLTLFDKALDKLESRGFDMSNHKTRVRREMESRDIPPPPDEDAVLDPSCNVRVEDARSTTYQLIPRLIYFIASGKHEDDIYTSFKCGTGRAKIGRKFEVKHEWEAQDISTTSTTIKKNAFTLGIPFRSRTSTGDPASTLGEPSFGQDFYYEWRAERVKGTSTLTPNNIRGRRLQDFQITGFQDGDEHIITLVVKDEDALGVPKWFMGLGYATDYLNPDDHVATVTWHVILREGEEKDKDDFDKLLSAGKTYVARKDLDEAQLKDSKLQLLTYSISKVGEAGAVKTLFTSKEPRYKEFRTNLVKLWVDKVKELVDSDKIVLATEKFNELNKSHGKFCFGSKFVVAGWKDQPCAKDIRDLTKLLKSGEVRISGKVFDQAGKPVEDADIYIDGTLDSKSDVDGSYVSKNPLAKKKYTIHAEKTGYYPSEIKTITVDKNTASGNKILILRKKGDQVSVILGQIVDKESGRPVQALTSPNKVTMKVTPDGRVDTSTDLVTQADGSFKVDMHLPSPPDGYKFKTVNLKTNNKNYLEAESEAIILDASQTSESFEIKAQSRSPNMGQIKVNVKGPVGPLSLADITLDASNVDKQANVPGNTNNQGFFLSDKIQPGQYFVFASNTAHMKSVPVPVLVGKGETKEITITLNKVGDLKGIIQGIVRDAKDQDLTVAANEIKLKRGTVDIPLTTSNLVISGKQFTISYLELDETEATPYTVTVTKDGFLAGVKNVPLTANAIGWADVRLLGPGTSLSGVIVTDATPPVPLEDIQLLINKAGSGKFIGNPVSLSGGAFTHSAGLEVDSAYTISLREDSAKNYFIVGENPPIIVKRNMAPIEIKIAKLGTANGVISVYALDLKSPVAGATVNLNGQYQGSTDKKGHAPIHNQRVPSDKPFKIEVTHSNYAPFTVDDLKFTTSNIMRVDANFTANLVEDRFRELSTSIGKLDTYVKQLDSKAESLKPQRTGAVPSLVETQITDIASVLKDIENVKRQIRADPPTTKAQADEIANAIEKYMVNGENGWCFNLYYPYIYQWGISIDSTKPGCDQKKSIEQRLSEINSPGVRADIALGG